MILYPAIDLKQGACVRLRAGRMEDSTLYNHDPAAQAQSFHRAGFDWLHVVDLDGAFAGTGRNRAAIEAIHRATRARVQLGGGLRDFSALEGWLALGVARLVLGTAAVRDPEFAKTACARFPGQIAIGIDARDGKVAVAGWAQQTQQDAIELARMYDEAGAAALIVTDIDRDGLKAGVNVEFTAAIANAVSAPVIASGGLRDLADLIALRGHHVANPGGRAISGAILGRALYDGDIDAQAALAAAA